MDQNIKAALRAEIHAIDVPDAPLRGTAQWERKKVKRTGRRGLVTALCCMLTLLLSGAVIVGLTGGAKWLFGFRPGSVVGDVSEAPATEMPTETPVQPTDATAPALEYRPVVKDGENWYLEESQWAVLDIDGDAIDDTVYLQTYRKDYGILGPAYYELAFETQTGTYNWEYGKPATGIIGGDRRIGGQVIFCVEVIPEDAPEEGTQWERSDHFMLAYSEDQGIYVLSVSDPVPADVSARYIDNYRLAVTDPATGFSVIMSLTERQRKDAQARGYYDARDKVLGDSIYAIVGGIHHWNVSGESREIVVLVQYIGDERTAGNFEETMSLEGTFTLDENNNWVLLRQSVVIR